MLVAMLALATWLPPHLQPAWAATPARTSSAAPAHIATLRVEDQGGRWLVWADNQLAGPAEVLVDFTESRNVRARPALPARATLPAGGSRVVSVVEQGDGPGEPRFRLQVRSLPGAPGTQPENPLYRFPLADGSARVDQGYGGSFSHQDAENRYALDLAVPQGTPVLAARDGLVMQVDASHRGDGRAAGGASGNFVRVLHRDGSMALYAHLQPGGVLVTPGREVRAGDRIGLSGDTGYTTGPHLHFAVQVNRGMQLASIPFRMDGLPVGGQAAAGERLRTRSGP